MGARRTLLFPRRAAEPYVRQISAAQAHQRLSAADLIINDLRRYWAFAAVMEQLRPAGLMQRRETHLAQLTASVPCYEYGLSAAVDRATAVDTITRLLPAQHLRVANVRQ